MKILFTGGSSFTGMWFLRELAEAGHEVTATFLRDKGSYSGLRLRRIEKVLPKVEGRFSCAFGEENFLEAVASREKWDLFCHHAAEVTDYKSADFDYAAALEKNTRNLDTVLEALLKRGCRRLLLTGSVFEQREGRGSDSLRAVSPYGLSKGLTSDVFCYYAQIKKMRLGKFVIPNPFGPYEEPRFTAFLMREWFEGKTAKVSSPAYIRDNIHVSLLAKGYRRFAESLIDEAGFEKLNPSGYRGSQGEFTARFAEEMRPRLGLPCRFELMEQKEFPEPKERVNSDELNPKELQWNEKSAWDAIAEYYKN